MHTVPQSTRDQYITTFLDINSQINLSSTRTPERVQTVHIDDTLRVFDAPFVTDHEIFTHATTGLDVGT